MMTETEVIAHIEGLSSARLELCIREAWVAPAHTNRGRVFDALDLARLRLITELADDLLVDDNAMPIILSLIDQIHGLRRRLQQLDENPGPGPN